MATYQQIIDKINAITDNGNNTAAEVRNVLTEILDFTKNPVTTPDSNVKFFHIWTQTLPVRDKLGNKLWYSLKGIEGQWVNFTFHLELDKTMIDNGVDENIFRFPLLSEHTGILDTLAKIMKFNTPTVRFLIPYTCVINDVTQDFSLSTSIYIQDKSIVFDFNNFILRQKEEMAIISGKSTTSVSFHYPEFVLENIFN